MIREPWSFFSPAKINLFLQVKGKRKGGYHEISSLFHAIDLGDTLTFSPYMRDLFTSNATGIPSDGTNLVIVALSKFREKTGVIEPVHIHLEKRIPMQAGLGGGSSNAATALYALSQIYRLRIADEILASWGSEIGSDVPFFFSSGCALCTGRGEIVSPETASLKQDLWIAKPPYGLSTPEVYRKCRPTPEKEISFTQDYSLLRNDLEMAAFQIHPALISVKKRILDLGFDHVQMTGSGTAFYCIGSPTRDDPLLFCNSSAIKREKNKWYLSPKKTNIRAGKLGSFSEA